MSLQLAIDQITRPTWWNDPTQPWKSNIKKRNETVEQRKLLMDSLNRKRTAKTMEELAKEFDCSIAKIRSLAYPFVQSGTLIRGANKDGKITLKKVGK